jgi:large subunit ribosomal protein L10
MNKIKKNQIISDLSKDFSSSDAVFVISCPNLTAQKNQALRKKFCAANGKMYVAKNTLLLRVASENKLVKGLAPLFKNQITLVFAENDGIGIASIIKSNGLGEQITVYGGIFKGALIDASKFSFIASIPPLKILQAQLCGVLLSPLSKLAFVLKAASEKNNLSEQPTE